MPDLTNKASPSRQKAELIQRVERLTARVERINFRLGRGETKKVDKILSDELVMREAELKFKSMQLANL